MSPLIKFKTTLLKVHTLIIKSHTSYGKKSEQEYLYLQIPGLKIHNQNATIPNSV